MQSAPRTVRASAPTRVDLAGGTLDIWPLYLLVEGAVTVNAAISLRTHASLSAGRGKGHRLVAEDLGVEETLQPGAGSPGAGKLLLHRAILHEMDPDGSLTVVTRSEVPAGSGLGGSSSLAVSLLSALDAWQGREPDPRRTVTLAADLEARVIRTLTGTQDHLAAIHGGVSAIRYGPGGPSRRDLGSGARALEERGVLVFLGASRASATANWDMVRRALEGESRTLKGLAAIAGIAREMGDAVEAGEMDEAGRLLGLEWEQRRSLSPAVSTPETEKALEAARGAGALGGKICGAGGGGALFVVAPAGGRDRVREALLGAGCRDLGFRVDTLGLQVGVESTG